MSELPATVLIPIPDRGRTYTAERTVRLGDVDVEGELRLDSIARYLQDVATDDALDAGLSNAMGWVVRRTMIHVAQPACLNDRLSLTTFCSGYGRSWAERRTAISAADGGHVCVDAVSLWVQVDPVSGRPTRLSEDFHAIYDEAAGGRQVSSKLSLARLPAHLVGESWAFRGTDLDPFGHVNNAAQWVVMEELLARAGRTRVGTGEIEFLAPAGLRHGLVEDGDAAWLIADGSPVSALRWSVTPSRRRREPGSRSGRRRLRSRR